ncbi:hypothetical protein [Streptomyces indicus]|uniref:DUF7847 domain-containing protein n=1 Tax=Streptomyces indicus TaxID=417292 RepID=A0A1G9FHJ1_9ACTN|nr:hypothetical protein [Streptomyces indicus]SDK87822.1 hypothetical protein SAMN05421806_113125 [Streptomyces indicus]
MSHPGWAPPAPYAPAPPKPGVIPLAPLSLGDYFGAFADLVRGYGRPLIGLGAAVVGALYAVTYACSTLGLLYLGSDDPFLTVDQGLSGALVTVIAAAVLLGAASTLVAYTTVAALCPAVLRSAVLGHRVSGAGVFRQAVRRIPALTGALLLAALACLTPVLLVAVLVFFAGPGAALLLVCALPFVLWFWTACSLAPAVIVMEGAGPLTALRRSMRLVRGNWWRVFGIQLLMALLATVASMALALPFDLLNSWIPTSGSDAVEIALGAVLLVPAAAGTLVSVLLSQTTAALLYTDRRIRCEGLAPALAEAAHSPR